MKNVWNNLKDFYEHNENGKMIFFFVFYVFFFLIVFLIIFSNRNHRSFIQEYEQGDSSLIHYEEILNQNYMYDYKVTLDDTLYDYYGKRFEDVDSFKFNNIDYYRSQDSFFMNQGTWIKVDNPILFYSFMKEEYLDSIIQEATYASVTTYDDGSNDYHYYLSSNTLFDIFYHENTDYDEIPNEMIISVDRDGSINKIIYQLNSYCQVIDTCSNTLTIEVTYDLFGNIKKIDNPLE